MFDITGDHLVRLSDEALRTLVARLCEAELRQANLPLAAITAGGSQDAKDGGIDVRVELPDESPALDFIPRNTTGFQIKLPDMPAKAIMDEMRPKGRLRPSIINLALKGGAYVIISAQGSTADSALENRKSAMKSGIAGLPPDTSLYLDFYDRDRLARWVRNYPGVTLWLREQIGEPLAGWRQHGNWAYGDMDGSEYLFDDRCRIIAPQISHNPLTVEQGTQSMRAILANSGGIVRLIGLSGTGKTRLVQALFDYRAGNDALDRSLAVYVDQGGDQSPIPSVRDMIHRLAANRQRAILVVDNCSPKTHRELAQAIGRTGASLSLITVEHDVADDDPEETYVFRLEPASKNIIEKILQRLTPHVSQTDSRRIAEFSGGNARVALALARTVTSSENIATLNDLELFTRLFYQRNDKNTALQRVASVCSLVYSFDGETIEGDGAELPVLAKLAEISPNELFHNLNELRSRDLVQCRSKWRAVLPHALANRLAQQALDSIHISFLTSIFLQEGNERLLKSFSRRLGYLHDCGTAKLIAERWLSPSALLSDPAHLNPLGISIFMNMAPLRPDLALQAIETAALGEREKEFLSIETPNRWHWIKLLRAIAYERQYFRRAALLLARYFAQEPANHNHNSACDSFKELFHLHLSGTHALVEDRLKVVQELLEAKDLALNTAGLEALDAMLESTRFRSSHDFGFGGRSRDFGWKPESGNDVSMWFREVVSFAKRLVTLDSPRTSKIKLMFAKHFRGLWTHAGICVEIEELVRDFFTADNQAEWWLAIRNTIHYDVEMMFPASAKRIRILESELRPVKLEQKIRAHILSSNYGEFTDAEVKDDGTAMVYEKAWERATKTAEDLGTEAISAPKILTMLLPEFFHITGRMKWQFGRGLANGTSNLDETWWQLCSVLGSLSGKENDISLLRGFIEAAYARDPVKVNQFLDDAITDPILSSIFAILQSSIRIDEVGAQRLILAIAHGRAQSKTFRHLNLGGVSNSIPLSSLRQILVGIVSLPHGYEVAIDIFRMRLFFLRSSELEIDREIVTFGSDLLKLNDFRSKDQIHANRVNEIASVCLQGEAAYEDALKICFNLNRALLDYRRGAMWYNGLTSTLFRLQPVVALTIFLDGKADSETSLSRLSSYHTEHPVSDADPEILLLWAKEKPAIRFAKLAKEVQLFVNGECGALIWSPLTLEILESAPDQQEILNIFASRFYPRAWSGSLADALLPYLNLVKKLQVHNDPQVRIWAEEQSVALSAEIEEEHKRDRQLDEGFEE